MAWHLAGRPELETPSILIIDDISANIAVLAEQLGGHGFSVSVAQDGEEGITRAQFGQPDLILLDVMMPGLNGFDTCKCLKSDQSTGEIPVIFMTAQSDIADKIAGYQCGAVDYVTKPFHTAELLARMHTQLNMHAMRRQLVAQNRQLQEEIAVRNAAEAVLAQRSQELARSNAELEHMAYVASHDLQEPLRMVASYLQLLVQRHGGRLDGDAHEFIGFAVDGAKRMQALIADLLAYSRVATKARPLRPTDSGAVLDTVRQSLRMALQESSGSIECGRMPVVEGDAAQLAQLFQNLLSNALKFRGPQPPVIRVQAAAVADGWQFSVQDNGIGIAPAYFERIFVMFQRLHRRSQYEGTGIGLAICKKIVERHGGRLWVESAPGQGATFRFTLQG